MQLRLSYYKMILAGGSVHVIILEHPETRSFVQFALMAFGLCLWTCHFSNPEIFPMILRHSGSECCAGCGSSCKEKKGTSCTRNVFGTLPGGLWLRTDGMSHCVTPLNLMSCLSLPHCWQGVPVGNARSWLAQWPTGGPWRYLRSQETPRGKARLGQACADPDPATQGPGVWLWLGFHSVFVSQETPGLGGAPAALLTVVQQKVVFCSVWYNRRGWICCDWQMAQTWLFCLGQWVHTAFNLPWKSELLAPLLEKGGRKRQIQFYSIHNFNNKMLLYTALVLLHYLRPLPPELGSWNVI